MSELEPEDQIDVNCWVCGEGENIKHVDGAEWYCNVCADTFSDGSDEDDSGLD